MVRCDSLVDGFVGRMLSVTNDDHKPTIMSQLESQSHKNIEPMDVVVSIFIPRKRLVCPVMVNILVAGCAKQHILWFPKQICMGSGGVVREAGHGGKLWLASDCPDLL